eukprot:SAG31_NODE_3_length_45830_cov_42.279701_36_plen_288_part_00
MEPLGFEEAGSGLLSSGTYSDEPSTWPLGNARQQARTTATSASHSEAGEVEGWKVGEKEQFEAYLARRSGVGVGRDSATGAVKSAADRNTCGNLEASDNTGRVRQSEGEFGDFDSAFSDAGSITRTDPISCEGTGDGGNASRSAPDDIWGDLLSASSSPAPQLPPATDHMTRPADGLEKNRRSQQASGADIFADIFGSSAVTTLSTSHPHPQMQHSVCSFNQGTGSPAQQLPLHHLQAPQRVQIQPFHQQEMLQSTQFGQLQQQATSHSHRSSSNAFAALNYQAFNS